MRGWMPDSWAVKAGLRRRPVGRAAKEMDLGEHLAGWVELGLLAVVVVGDVSAADHEARRSLRGRADGALADAVAWCTRPEGFRLRCGRAWRCHARSSWQWVERTTALLRLDSANAAGRGLLTISKRAV